MRGRLDDDDVSVQALGSEVRLRFGNAGAAGPESRGRAEKKATSLLPKGFGEEQRRDDPEGSMLLADVL